MNFAAYLRGIAERFPSRKALAQALGITPSRMSRAMSQDRADFPLNVENCLKLAKIADRPAREVLVAAGKEDVADLLDFLYPRAGKRAITGDQRDLLDEWELLNEDERKAFRLLIHQRGADRRKRSA